MTHARYLFHLGELFVVRVAFSAEEKKHQCVWSSDFSSLGGANELLMDSF